MRIAPTDWDEGLEADAFLERDEPTLCRECDHVHPDSKAKPPFQWRCMAHPAPPMGGFVDPDYRPDPPYHRCEKINTAGACPHWTPLRTPKDTQP